MNINMLSIDNNFGMIDYHSSFKNCFGNNYFNILLPPNNELPVFMFVYPCKYNNYVQGLSYVENILSLDLRASKKEDNTYDRNINLQINPDLIQGVYTKKILEFQRGTTSLGKKFEYQFKTGCSIVKFSINDYHFYVGKGIILDENYDPLIMITYPLILEEFKYLLDKKVEEKNSFLSTYTETSYLYYYERTIMQSVYHTYKFNKTKYKAYLNRKVFSDDFKNTYKRLNTEITKIFTNIIADNMDIEITVDFSPFVSSNKTMIKKESMDKLLNEDLLKTVKEKQLFYLDE